MPLRTYRDRVNQPTTEVELADLPAGMTAVFASDGEVSVLLVDRRATFAEVAQAVTGEAEPTPVDLKVRGWLPGLAAAYEAAGLEVPVEGAAEALDVPVTALRAGLLLIDRLGAAVPLLGLLLVA